MFDSGRRTFAKNEVTSWSLPNYWDIIALLLVLSVIFLIGWAATGMTTTHYQVGEVIPISLDPSALPYYSLRTVLRMLIGLVCSLIFTLTIGTLAAKSKRAEQVIIPLIDILQSVPVLGFQAIAVVPFIALFPGSLLGPECAAIFAIFTAQVWNMTLSFYQSCRTIPTELTEAVRMFRLSAWQRFWRMDVPHAMPGLIWNAMMSMSASWFFVVAAEAITVANKNITLPGIGSYIAAALPKADLHAVAYAIIAMFIVILAYDQLIFRPLSQWMERFRAEESDDGGATQSWIVSLFEHTRLMHKMGIGIGHFWDAFVNWPWFRVKAAKPQREQSEVRRKLLLVVWYALFYSILISAVVFLVWYVIEAVALKEVAWVVSLGLMTGLRVMVLIMISSLIWVPVGVWIGLRPRVTKFVQPLIQFLASFPAYLLFPVVVMVIVRYHLNPEVWTSPLMVLGTQWYILFNVIAGTLALPKDLRLVASNFQVRGWLWWKRLILPGIFPYFLTGAITAAGGAWNASIVAEVVTWGDTTIRATGLGSYIAAYSRNLDYPRLALGIAVMCLLVVIINRILWRPLYNMAEKHYLID
jgi:NitT/TauT family transport system permease protein